MMTKSKRNFLSGAIILIVCSLLSKIIGAIYKIPLLKTLGSAGLGEYQMIFSVFALFLVVCASGISVALSKLISREEQVKNKKNQHSYFVAGMGSTLLLAFFCMAVFIFLIPSISQYQGSSNLIKSYYAIAPAIIIASTSAVFRGYFLGKLKMTYAGISQIANAITKLVFSLFLSVQFAKANQNLAVCGAVLGVTIAEMFSLGLLIIFYFRQKKRKTKYEAKIIKKELFLKSKNQKILYFCAKRENISVWRAFGKLFPITFFVTIQSLIFPLVSAIDSIVVVPLLSSVGISKAIAFSLFGLEDGIVSSLIVMPTVVSQGISSAIIPNLGKNNNAEIIKNSIKIVWVFSIFCAFVFVLFSSDITNFLYAGGLSTRVFDETLISSDMLKINGFNIVYLSLLGLSTSILQGIGKSKTPVVNLIVSSAIRFVVLFFCLRSSELNIYGLAISNMLFYALALLLNLLSLKRYVNFTFSFSNIFGFPILSCIAMSFVMVFLKALFTGLISSKIVVLLIMFFGSITYFVMLMLTKVLNIRENFGTIFEKFKQKISKNTQKS